MKKWFLILALGFDCSMVLAGQPEKVETLSSKVILQNANGYFVLSDKSCWKVVGFVKRWRTPSEWWNRVQLVPKNYECVPNDWYLGAQIEAYPKHGNLEVDEANASNQETLKQCTHLLINSGTGQVLFAIALQPAECLIQLFSEAHTDGYAKGYQEGRLKSYENAREIYNNGYSDGHAAGYKEGYQAGSGAP